MLDKRSVPRAGLATVLAVALYLASSLTAAALLEDSVEFQDGAGSAVQSLSPGGAAVFYLRDDDLATTGTCTGTWTNIGVEVDAEERLNLANGNPDPDSYSLSEGCVYDTETPTSTPLIVAPYPPIWSPVVTVDQVDVIVTCCEDSPDEIALFTRSMASSTIEVVFTFDVVDAYSSSQRRVNVSSTSDPEGEWPPMSEVASESNDAPSPTSGVFRGEALLSADQAALTDEGVVRVQAGDTLTVTYFEANATTTIGSHEIAIEATEPTPLTGASLAALAALAGVFVAVIAWRLRRPFQPSHT